MKKSLLLLGLYIFLPDLPDAHAPPRLQGSRRSCSFIHTRTHTHAYTLEQGPKSFLTVSLLRVPGEGSAGTG